MGAPLLKTLCESLAKRLLQQNTPARHKNTITSTSWQRSHNVCHKTDIIVLYTLFLSEVLKRSVDEWTPLRTLHSLITFSYQSILEPSEIFNEVLYTRIILLPNYNVNEPLLCGSFFFNSVIISVVKVNIIRIFFSCKDFSLIHLPRQKKDTIYKLAPPSCETEDLITIWRVQDGTITRSKVWVCGRLLAGIVGSKPAGRMIVCLLWVLCTVRWSSPRRADHSSRGILPSAVCLSVIGKPR